MNKKPLILASISMSLPLLAQDVSTIRNTTNVYDNNINTGTAKYTAMAGAMGALGGDISSISSNPAGLGVFITSDIAASLAINSTKTTSSFAGQSITNDNSTTKLGQAGGVFSFQTEESSTWKFINFGVNYTNESIDNIIQTPKNFNISEPFTNENGNKDYRLYSGHIYETVGHRSKLSVGLGGNYDNKIYVGAGVHFSSSDVEQYDQTLIASQNNPSRGWVFRKQDTPFKEDTGGFSLSFGVIGKINKQIRVGASFETPTWYNIDREYINYNNHNGNISSTAYTESRNLRTPSKLTLSGAFIPNKHFAFNVDYRLDVGKPHFSGRSDAEKQLNDFYQSIYKAQNEVRLGGEYRFKNFRVRGGYAFTTSPFKNYTSLASHSNNGDIIKNKKVSNYIVGESQVISGGLGYDFKSFYVDATYQHLTQTYTNPFFDGLYVLTGNSGAYFNHGNSIISDTKTKKGNFILTLGWKF